MPLLERRAWLALWAMCPPYVVYFAIQAAAPSWLDTLLQRIACLAATSLTHALIYGIGVIVISRRKSGEDPVTDERDRAIDTRATRAAYFVLLAGMIVVGMVMPFKQSGWQIVNAALLGIVLAETLRNILILQGYRGAPNLAHG